MIRRICVFCGSYVGNDASYARVAAETARAIARAGCSIVYGGGSIGLMGVLADAALEAHAQVVGVIPQSLAGSEIAHPGLTHLHVVASMHARKAMMAELSDAFIALPGGFGTMDEFCEILTWRQLGIHDKPIGLLNTDGFFDHLLALFDSMQHTGFITPEHRKLFVESPRIGKLLQALAAGHSRLPC